MLRIFSDSLYHGTIDRIPLIDVTKGKPRKDFGRGFYMALNAQQAIGMMHSCLCTQKAVDEGVVNFDQLDWRRLS